MSKKQFKSQASSSRVSQTANPFGVPAAAASSAFGSGGSPLSYLAEQPDLSLLSDPNVVVSFKNLAKRDSTTKAKALEDLQTFVGASNAIEEAFLDAWVKVYPRTSIDVSRRVRQLAHTVHGQTCLSSGKRVARHMPAVIGAWLSGLHDGDKVVSRAAQEALQRVFSTPEKQDNLWKVYQSAIASFAHDAILKENAQTLSDERITTKEDSEAKYFRVVSSSIAVVTDLLTKLDKADIDKIEDVYTEVLSEKSLWDFISSKDVHLRRAVMRLLRTCISKHPNLISSHTDIVKKAVLSKATLRRQTGSSAEFIELLIVLARFMNSFWDDSGNTPVLELLQGFFKQGSHSGPSYYWDRVTILFTTLPLCNQDMDSTQVLQTLEALHTGIIRRDEPRSSQDSAWSCYFNVVDTLVQRVQPEARLLVLQDFILPIIRQVINPNQDDAAWTISGSKAIALASKGLRVTDFDQLASESWVSMAVDLVSRMQVSLPEQSKEFASSQEAIKNEAERWFTLQSFALAEPSFEPLVDSTTNLILNKAFEQLQLRNGKPYGAAATIEAVLTSIGPFVLSKDRLRDSISAFTLAHMPDLILSPSGPYLTSAFYQCSNEPGFNDAWTKTLNVVLRLPEGPAKHKALHTLLDPFKLPPDFSLAFQSSDLQTFVKDQARTSLLTGQNWPAVLTSKGSSTYIAEPTMDDVLSDMTSNLDISGHTRNALTGLQAIISQHEIHLKSYITSPKGSELMRNILHATESADEGAATLAAEINASLQELIASDSGDPKSSSSMLTVIEQGLYEAGMRSISVNALADLASKTMSTHTHEEVVSQLLPDPDRWLEALKPFVTAPIPRSLAITTSLGGAVYLVDESLLLVVDSKASQINRDAKGFSTALRIALYFLKVFGQPNARQSIPLNLVGDIYALFYAVVQLAGDELGLLGANNLWSSHNLDTEEEMMEFISDSQSLLREWLKDEHSLDGAKATAAFSAMRPRCLGAEPMSLHMSRAYSGTVTQILDNSQASQRTLPGDLDNELKQLRKDGNIIMLTAFMTGYSSALGSSPYLSRTCNECLADLTGLDIESKTQDALKQLVIMNTILRDQDHLIGSIAKQRLIFYTLHVVPWLRSTSVSLALKAEVCKSLVSLLPSIADVYGDHWQSILDELPQIWSEPVPNKRIIDARIPLYHASLKLFNSLGSLVGGEDTNEDLKDAWGESGEKLSHALLALLTQLGATADTNNQPLRIVNDLLARQISAQPPRSLDQPEELYGLIASESSAVQHTAFEILHKQIPRAQEQVSLDAALESTTAKLPEELLSLILDPPPASYDSASFERSMPAAVRTYLSSWLLVFDHFRNASDKVKADYATQLKDGGYLDSLLTFTFSFLGHAHGRPIDPSKFDIAAYGFDLQESPVKDVQWLLSHLYFLCLQRMPSLAKTWWLDSKSRQIRVNVESWTEKYISPLIISTALDQVTTWAASQDASSDEALIVKANYRTKEVTAAKEIDEQMMTMAIRLPPNFPLGQAEVIGYNRVAVDEKKWRSWLHNCQGVILFSNNSLIDGIIAFRRNVAGALKGQTECAICYSLVSADKQLPTKRCGTCKNLFHGSCLYRWFKSSNSSSCPLCRTSFNYS